MTFLYLAVQILGLCPVGRVRLRFGRKMRVLGGRITPVPLPVSRMVRVTVIIRDGRVRDSRAANVRLIPANALVDSAKVPAPVDRAPPVRGLRRDNPFPMTWSVDHVAERLVAQDSTARCVL